MTRSTSTRVLLAGVQPREYASSRVTMGAAWRQAVAFTRSLALQRLLMVSLQRVGGNKDVFLNYTDATRDIREEDICINE